MAVKKQSYYFFVILGFAALYAAFGFLYALDKRDTTNGLYEIFRDKVLAARQVSGQSRILLLGGSNALWGFRSQIIEDETDIPTFNLALLHEAYDPKAMRELGLSVARPGDIVVYSSVSFWNSRSTDPNAAQELLRVAGLERNDSVFQTFMKGLDRYWTPVPQKSTIIASIGPLYQRYILQVPSIHSQGLTAKGDVASCNKGGEVGPAGFVDPPERESFFREIRGFEDALRIRGASLVLAFPAVLIRPEQKQAWIQAYTPFLQDLHRDFLLATPTIEQAISIEEPLFCDTGFHLGDAEAANRSRIMGRFLKAQKPRLQSMTSNVRDQPIKDDGHKASRPPEPAAP